jgi:hypothetical protein
MDSVLFIALVSPFFERRGVSGLCDAFNNTALYSGSNKKAMPGGLGTEVF